MFTVLLYSDRFHPIVGGTELQARRVAGRLAASGKARFLVLTRRHDPAWPEEEAVEGIRIHRLPPAGLGKKAELGFAFYSIVFLFRKRKEFEILHFLLVSFPNSLVALAGKLLGKKVLVKIAGAGVLRRGNPAARFIRNLILRRMDGFLATTAEIEREFGEAGFAPGRIQLIPNGVDAGHFAPVLPGEKRERRRVLGLPPEGKIALYAGRISREKGPQLLVRAWLGLAGEIENAFLLLVGSGSRQEKSVEEEIGQLLAGAGEKGKRVLRPGEAADLSPYLQAADIFVLPSFQEGLSNALLEAMAAGLPVVASRLPGVLEALGADPGAVLFTPGEVEELVRALELMLAHPEDWPEAGRKNRKRVEERYTLEKVAGKYGELYGLLARAG